MKEISSHDFPFSDHDLFLEQTVVCQWLGIKDCFNRQLIARVLPWQHHSGCYKDIIENETDPR